MQIYRGLHDFHYICIVSCFARVISSFWTVGYCRLLRHIFKACFHELCCFFYAFCSCAVVLVWFLKVCELRVPHGVLDVSVSQQLHHMEDVFGLVVFHCCLPVSEGMKVDLEEPGVCQFGCASSALYAEVCFITWQLAVAKYPLWARDDSSRLECPNSCNSQLFIAAKTKARWREV